MTKNRTRLVIGALGLLLLIGLGWAVGAYRSSARIARVQALAEQVSALPPEQSKAAREQLRVEMARLSPDQRRQVFEQGFDRRLDAYFAASPSERTAMLDRMIARFRSRPGSDGPRTRPASPTKTVGTVASGSSPNRGGGRGSWRNLSPEQRDQRRRARLDRTTPEQRARRSEFFAALRARREQLGLASGTRRR